MSTLRAIYRHSLGLLTDLYQLTMAQGYWKTGREDLEAVFHLFFRRCPFGSAFAVFCGLAQAMEYLEVIGFDDEDIGYLGGLEGADGRPLFEAEFLEFLHGLSFECDVDAAPEGSLVFAGEPLLRVKGPLLQAQIVETALLNIINFQTLIATKAARVASAARPDAVLEFGLRRAQGMDGGLSASRAAYVGGCAATSNVLAGKLFDIPVRGTHAHSWVMVFDDELEAFEAYAEAMPGNCVFLVDTYDTLEGVRRAARVGRKLEERGYELLGVRLDSGDLLSLSKGAREILDEQGFPDAAITASNDLDEGIIAELKRRGATITVWGVGTRLATGYDQPALGGVYKLAGIRRPGESWQPKLKLSEEPAKVSIPGVLQVRRFVEDDRFVGDMIYDVELGLASAGSLVDLENGKTHQLPRGADSHDLLEPLFRAGLRVVDIPTAAQARERARSQLDGLDLAHARLEDPSRYLVGLEQELSARRERLVALPVRKEEQDDTNQGGGSDPEPNSPGLGRQRPEHPKGYR
jgi:nicotinate phosphoribosyltransferase